MRWLPATLLMIMLTASWAQQLERRMTNEDVLDMVGRGASVSILPLT